MLKTEQTLPGEKAPMETAEPAPGIPALVIAGLAFTGILVSLLGDSQGGGGRFENPHPLSSTLSLMLLALVLATHTHKHSLVLVNVARRVIPVLVAIGNLILHFASVSTLFRPGSSTGAPPASLEQIEPNALYRFILVFLAAGFLSQQLEGKLHLARRRLVLCAALLIVAFTGFNAVSLLANLPLWFSGPLEVVPFWNIAVLGLLALGLATVSGAEQGIHHYVFGDIGMPQSEITPADKRRQRIILAGFCAANLTLLLGAYFYLQLRVTQTHEALQTNLKNITSLKVNQIEAWRRERLADAYTLRKAPLLLEQLSALEKTGSTTTLQKDYTAFIEEFLRNYNYREAIILNAHLEPVLCVPTTASLNKLASPSLLNDLHKAKDIRVGELHVDTENKVTMDLIIPLQKAEDGQLLGAIWLAVDCERGLMSLLQRGSNDSSSTESQLLRLEKPYLIFLEKSGAGRQSQLELMQRGRRPRLLAEKAAYERAMPLSEGLNRRGNRVFGVAVPIHNSPWVMFTKIDQDEAYSRLRGEAVGLTVSFALVAIIGGLLLSRTWRKHLQQISQRQQELEHHRKAAVERLGLVMRHANDAIFLIDEQMRILEASERVSALYGYSVSEAKKLLIKDLRAEESKKTTASDFNRALNEGSRVFECLHRHRNGNIFPVEVSARSVEIEGRRLVLSIVRDISERRRHEQEIERLTRMYFLISQVNKTIIHAKTRTELFTEICRVLVEFGHFKIAWIGWPDAVTQMLEPVACSGDEHSYVAGIRISANPEHAEGQGPSGIAFRTGRTYVCNDFLSNTHTGPWRERASKSGINASISIPLQQEGKTIGLLMAYAAEKDFFGAREIALMEESAGNVSFALDVILSESQRKLTELALRNSESRLQFLLTATPAIIYSIEAFGDNATNFISDNVREVIGFEPEDFKTDPSFWLEHLHPEDLAASTEAFGRLNTEASITREYRFQHKDGSYRWMHDEARLVRSKDGQPLEIVGYWFDITARKEAEESLIAREGIFSNIVGQAVDAIALVERETGRFIEFNTAAHHGLGYSREEFSRLSISQLQADPRHDQLSRNSALITQVGGIVFEGQQLHKNGSLREVRVSARAITLQGRDCLTLVWSDMTERKRIETDLHKAFSELRVSEERTRAIFENANVGMFEMNLEGRLQRGNLRLSHMLDTDMEALSTLSLSDFVQEDYHAVLESLIQNLHERSNRTLSLELRCHTTKGLEFWGSLALTLEISPLGTATSCIGVLQDITQEVAAHQTLQSFNSELESKVAQRTEELAARNSEVQALLQAIPDMVMKIGRDGAILHCQRAHVEGPLAALGCKADCNATGCIQTGLMEPVRAIGARAMEKHSTLSTEAELTLNGTSTTIELRASPIGDSAFVVFIRDITARRRLELEMANTLLREREISEMKGRFISVTSHEFRTPMAAALGSAELLSNHLERLQPAKRQELFGRINTSLHRMNTMLDDILNLNQAESGRIRVQLVEINMGEFLGDLLSEIRVGDREAHVFEFSETGDGRHILSDPTLIRHVASNLLSNAVRYSPRGTEVSLKLDARTDHFRITVEDRGIGIPEEDHKRIFEAFERGSNVGEIRGTGLGLNIVKKMSELLGGSITLSTPKEGGSRFVVDFPLPPPAGRKLDPL